MEGTHVDIPETDAFAPNIRPDCTDALTAALRERIMVIDGAMGTAIQRDRPDEAGYRGERFADWPSDLVGNNDLLTLTQPGLFSFLEPGDACGRSPGNHGQAFHSRKDPPIEGYSPCPLPPTLRRYRSSPRKIDT